jgi:hypothetical protein
MEKYIKIRKSLEKYDDLFELTCFNEFTGIISIS